MIYKWKTNYFPCDAQVAGNELRRIHDRDGSIQPEAVVNESRPVTAPLHNCFTWDDTEAARLYRERQARDLIRNIAIVSEESAQGSEKPEPIRAFFHVQKGYQPIGVVVQNVDMLQELKASALRDMERFCKKYEQITELRPVIDTIAMAMEQLA